MSNSISVMPRCTSASANVQRPHRHLRTALIPTLAFVIAVFPIDAQADDDSNWVGGTTVTEQPEVDDEDGTWADSNCTDSDSDSGAVTSYGIGLTYFDYTYPSDGDICPSDSSTKKYSKAGDANYENFYVGVESLSESSSSGCSYSYKNHMHTKKCCDKKIYDCDELDMCDWESDGRTTTCDFDTEAEAYSFVNTDGTVFFEYVEAMDEADSDKHEVDYSATVTFPAEVFAAVPVLAGTTNALKDGAKIKEWKTEFSSSSFGYVSDTTEVTFSGEVYVHGDSEHLDADSSMLGATLIGLPTSIPGSVEDDGGRVPIIAVFQVAKDNNATCVGVYGRQSSSTTEYTCEDDDTTSPNYSTSGAQITFTVTDLASNQQISQESTVFIQSGKLAYNDQHHINKIKLSSGQNNIAIDSTPTCSSSSNECSQKIVFTPAFEMEDNSHSENSDSYINVALLVLFEYEDSSSD